MKPPMQWTSATGRDTPGFGTEVPCKLLAANALRGVLPIVRVLRIPQQNRNVRQNRLDHFKLTAGVCQGSAFQRYNVTSGTDQVEA